jgi:hypothetical protein
MKGGISGDDCFLSKGSLGVNVPLTFVLSEDSFVGAILTRGGISSVGEGVGEDSEGVSICRDVVVLELDRECAFALEDRLVEVLVIVRHSLKQRKEIESELSQNKDSLLLCYAGRQPPPVLDIITAGNNVEIQVMLV